MAAKNRLVWQGNFSSIQLKSSVEMEKYNKNYLFMAMNVLPNMLRNTKNCHNTESIARNLRTDAITTRAKKKKPKNIPPVRLTVKCKFQFRTWIGAIHFQVLVYLVFELNIEIKKTSHDFGSIQMSLGVFVFSVWATCFEIWTFYSFSLVYHTQKRNSCRMDGIVGINISAEILHAIRNGWIFLSSRMA